MRPGWYVEVRLSVDDELPGNERRIKRRAAWIGPMSWSGARALCRRWEREFGADTTALRDAPPLANRIVLPVADAEYGLQRF